MEPNSNGVTQTPVNSTQSEVETLKKQVSQLMERLDNQSVSATPGNQPAQAANFKDRYWFTSLQMVTVLNPTWYREGGDGTPVSRDYEFMVEMRHFIVRAGQTERFPGVIANVYLDQMSKIIAQNEEKLSFMSDPAMKKIYYDKLIVNVEDLAPIYNPTAAYLRDVAPSAIGQAPDETPPWDNPNLERARDIAPNALPPAPVVDKPLKNPQPTEKEFELEEIKYKMIVDKNGKEMFYKSGQLTSAAEYAKAASML